MLMSARLGRPDVDIGVETLSAHFAVYLVHKDIQKAKMESVKVGNTGKWSERSSNISNTRDSSRSFSSGYPNTSRVVDR